MKTIQIKRAAAIAALGGVLAAVAACTTMGTGSGDVAHNGGPVRFAWQARGADTSGTMTATLADGRTFSGPFVQVVQQSRIDLDPMWVGWHAGWRDWRWGDYAPDLAFETLYGGKVVANLQGPANDRMRCHFVLNDPLSGLSGGGQGQCQLADGRKVDAVFPHA